MAAKICLMAALLVAAGVVAAAAAPNIPPSERPGRERERFTPSPVDRFTDPFAWPRTEPLLRWCDDEPTRRSQKKKSERNKGC